MIQRGGRSYPSRLSAIFFIGDQVLARKWEKSLCYVRASSRSFPIEKSMAPRDPTRLALRWEFKPIQTPQGLIRWTWNAYTQWGKLQMEAGKSFETYTECGADAKLHGYQVP